MKKFPLPRLRSHVAGIELGSSKIACWLVAQLEDENMTVLGAGHAASKGLQAGRITDVGALETQLNAAIYEAERQANTQIHQAVLTLGGHCFRFDYQVLKAPILEGSVTERELDLLWSQLYQKDRDCVPVHVIPMEFCIDGQDKIKDPRGMTGKVLMGYFHIVWIHKSRLHTILECLKRCQIQVVGLVFSAYSSGLSCLSKDEQELGSAVMDIGAYCINGAFFFGGQMVGACSIPLGGYHITQDIARGCETRLSHAERLKILYGAAIPAPNDHREMLPIVSLGVEEEVTMQIPRSLLINIIQARAEEMCQMMKKKLDEVATFQPFSCQRVVLTGGGSQLPGLREMACRILERPVRIGKPYSILKAPFTSGEFSAVTGTFFYTDPPMLLQEGSLLFPLRKVGRAPLWKRMVSFFGKS